jgi:hypothetical protein
MLVESGTILRDQQFKEYDFEPKKDEALNCGAPWFIHIS